MWQSLWLFSSLNFDSISFPHVWWLQALPCTWDAHVVRCTYDVVHITLYMLYVVHMTLYRFWVAVRSHNWTHSPWPPIDRHQWEETFVKMVLFVENSIWHAFDYLSVETGRLCASKSKLKVSSKLHQGQNALYFRKIGFHMKIVWNEWGGKN